jgi:hypothetical protein
MQDYCALIASTASKSAVCSESSAATIATIACKIWE